MNGKSCLITLLLLLGCLTLAAPRAKAGTIVGAANFKGAKPAVPMIVLSVKAPAMSPAAVPQSYPSTLAATTARLVTHKTCRQRHLRHRVLLEATKELWAYLVAGCE